MTGQTRLCFTVTNDLNYDQRMQRICTSLSQRGYDVTLIGRKKPDSIGLFEQPFQQYRLKCVFTKGKLFYLEINIRLFFYLLKNKMQGICAVDLDTILPALLAARLKGIPLFHDAHEYFAEVPEVVNRPMIRKSWELIARFAIPRSDCCYTVSSSLADVLEKRYKQTFHVIRNVPWLEKPDPVENEESFILYQGALNEGRGLETLIICMHHLDIPLYLAGEGDLSTKLRQQVKQEGLTNKIHFLGYLSPEALKKLTPKAFVGFNVLENKGLNYYYSLPNKFFDYIHAGVPVLTNDYPEYRKINEEFKVAYLLELDEQDIVDTIRYLLENPGIYNEMVRNCLEAGEKFNWDNEQHHLIRLYDAYFCRSENEYV